MMKKSNMLIEHDMADPAEFTSLRLDVTYPFTVGFAYLRTKPPTQVADTSRRHKTH